jgi:hypothetical protein
VRRKREVEPQLLGDFDEEGGSLVDQLGYFMENFEATSTDGTTVVRGLSCVAEDDEVRIILQHGANGVAADIVDENGILKTHQTPEDTQLVRCGALFSLPPAEKIGFLAVHVNNRRGIKGLLAKGLTERFRNVNDDHILVLTPAVSGSALEEAVRLNRIDKIKLTRLERPEDRAIAATDKWVPAGEVGRLELDITVRGEGRRVLSGLIGRYLAQEQGVFGQIVEFEGLTFDEAKVEVVLPNNKRRTFNIEKPDSGHAITEELTDLETNDQGDPTEESLFEALRQAITHVGE